MEQVIEYYSQRDSLPKDSFRTGSIIQCVGWKITIVSTKVKKENKYCKSLDTKYGLVEILNFYLVIFTGRTLRVPSCIDMKVVNFTCNILHHYMWSFHN